MRCIALLVVGTLIPACAAPSQVPRLDFGSISISPTAAPSPVAELGDPGAPPTADATPQAAPKPSEQVQHVTLYLGHRQLDDNTIRSLNIDSQTMAGVEYDSYAANSGSGYEAGFQASNDSRTVAGTSVEAKLREIYFGYRKTFMPDRDFHPLVGAGFSIIKGSFDFGPSDDDLEFAPYVQGGVSWDIGDRLSIGADLRLLFGHFDALGGVDADYSQIAATLGYRF